jgi:hypothetical protein
MTKPIKIILTDELREKHRIAAAAHRAAAMAWLHSTRVDDPECLRLAEEAINASSIADCGNGFLPWTKTDTPAMRHKAHDDLARHHAHMAIDVAHDSLGAKRRD